MAPRCASYSLVRGFWAVYAASNEKVDKLNRPLDLNSEQALKYAMASNVPAPLRLRDLGSVCYLVREIPPPRRWRHSEFAAEVMTQRNDGAETRQVADVLHRLVGFLQQPL